MSQIRYRKFKFTWESCFSWLVGCFVHFLVQSSNPIYSRIVHFDGQLGISDTGYK